MYGQAQQKKRLESIIHDMSDTQIQINWVEGALHMGFEDLPGEKVVYTAKQIILVNRYKLIKVKI